MTFVKVRIALDRISSGEILKVSVTDTEAKRNIPVVAAELGYQILGAEDAGNNIMNIWIKKPES